MVGFRLKAPCSLFFGPPSTMATDSRRIQPTYLSATLIARSGCPFPVISFIELTDMSFFLRPSCQKNVFFFWPRRGVIVIGSREGSNDWRMKGEQRPYLFILLSQVFSLAIKLRSSGLACYSLALRSVSLTTTKERGLFKSPHTPPSSTHGVFICLLGIRDRKTDRKFPWSVPRASKQEVLFYWYSS